MIQKLVFLIISTIVGMASISQVSAQTLPEQLSKNRLVLITDYDNTLTGPGWKTMWFLKKIPRLQTYFQTVIIKQSLGGDFDSLPQEIPVTEREFFDFIREKMAVVENNGQQTARSYKTIELPAIAGVQGRETPKSFIPGIYTVGFETFRNFRTARESSQLLQDNSQSKLSETPQESRRGVSFPLFQKLASTPQSMNNIFILTARAQEDVEFEELFEEWRREGLLASMAQSSRSGKINVYPLGRGEALMYGEKITQRKVEIVRDHILTSYRLHAKPKGEKYTIVIAENDPDTVRDYFKMLLEISPIKEYQKYLEFILIHAGTDAEVARSPLPARVTTFDRGHVRAARPEIVKFLLKENSAGPALDHQQTVLDLSNRVGAKCVNIFGR